MAQETALDRDHVEQVRRRFAEWSPAQESIKLRWLENLLAVATTPFTHYGRCRIRRQQI